MARVLVIDDEGDIGRILSVVLGLAGHEVSLATNGSQGFAEARRSRPDVIVLDLMMPVMDGYSVLELLRSDARTSGVPTVVLSAVTTSGSERRCRALGAVAFIAKPFDPELVLGAVEDVVPSQTLPSEPIGVPTRVGSVKCYDVMHVNGDTYEVEAEFYEREGDDWVFYLNTVEVFRVAFLDVLSVTKTPTWVREEPATPEVWL